MDTNKEHSVDRLIHYTLLAGVSISATLLMVGLFIVLVRDTPRPEVAPPLSEILRMAFTVARVMMLVYGYARIGWWPFALVSLLVLLLLGTGFVLGTKG
jgi:uncharacterized membrane protein